MGGRRPRVVCLCGSLRFRDLVESERRRLTGEGAIVLAPEPVDDELTPARRAALGQLHLARIELADEVRVVSRDGHVGAATRREIAHARRIGTPITWVESGLDQDLHGAPTTAAGGATEPSVLVVVLGPQASGKTTVSAALAREWRRRGAEVALVELDQIAAMALPTLPSWEAAAEIFAEVAARWIQSGVRHVIAEGIASEQELSVLLARTPPETTVVTVAMTTTFEVALPRAQSDPTRGASRDRDWLAQRYREWAAEIERVPADLHLDAGTDDLEQCISRIDRWIDASTAP